MCCWSKTASRTRGSRSKPSRRPKFGNQLWIAEDGVEAMEFMRQEGRFADAPRPDLILLDLNLPRKDGREVLKELKEHPSWRQIPVVVLTVSQAEEDVPEGLQSACELLHRQAGRFHTPDGRCSPDRGFLARGRKAAGQRRVIAIPVAVADLSDCRRLPGCRRRILSAMNVARNRHDSWKGFSRQA